MVEFLPTIILRHRKENLKKCSLRGLEKRDDMKFYTYPQQMDFSLDGYVMLYLDENAPELSINDLSKGLFFLDSTWSYEKKMHDQLKKKHQLIYRSLPKGFATAYPREQTHCDDPTRGLATLEAIFIAYTILKRDTSHLLENYYFASEFMNKNQPLLKNLSEQTC